MSTNRGNIGVIMMDPQVTQRMKTEIHASMSRKVLKLVIGSNARDTESGAEDPH